MLVSVNLKAGEVLLKEGSPSDCIYLLKSGELEIFKYEHEKSRHNIIGYVEPGEIFGEMSFLDNLPRSATVRAKTDCVVGMMNRAEFEKIFASQDPMIQSLVKTLSERLRKTNSLVRW